MILDECGEVSEFFIKGGDVSYVCGVSSLCRESGFLGYANEGVFVVKVAVDGD